MYAFIRLYVAKFNDAFDIYTMSLGFFKNRNFNLREQKLKSTLYQSTNEFNAIGTTYWLSDIDNSQNLVIQRTHTSFEFQFFLTDYILEILSIQFIRNLNSVHCTVYILQAQKIKLFEENDVIKCSPSYLNKIE